MDDRKQVSAALTQIVQAGMSGDIGGLARLLHDDVIMVFPGFRGQARGRAAMLGGFEDFTGHATVHDHEESDEQIDVVGDAAVGSYRFEITYTRCGIKYRSTGRDLWVFHRSEDRWLAVWRTMLDVEEEPCEPQ